MVWRNPRSPPSCHVKPDYNNAYSSWYRLLLKRPVCHSTPTSFSKTWGGCMFSFVIFFHCLTKGSLQLPRCSAIFFSRGKEIVSSSLGLFKHQQVLHAGGKLEQQVKFIAKKRLSVWSPSGLHCRCVSFQRGSFVQTCKQQHWTNAASPE